MKIIENTDDLMIVEQSKKSIGRPRVEIKWAEMEQLCQMQCTKQEVAFWFKCSVDTILRAIKKTYGIDWKDYFAHYSEGGKIALRRSLWQKKDKSDRILLALSEQHLGFKSKVDVTSDGKAIQSPPSVFIDNPHNDS